MAYTFGDTSGTLDDHTQAGSQTISQGPMSGLPDLVGDAAAMVDHSVGGDDTLSSVVYGITTVIGDALTMTGEALGGNDTLKAAVIQGDAATAYGDALQMGDRAMGGDDVISVGGVFASVSGYGDAATMTGEARGGNDTIAGSAGHGNLYLYGDAQAMSGNTLGGDDAITGYATSGQAWLYGDALTMTDHAHGGDDLVGPAALDQYPTTVYGDARTMGGYSVGGNDTLYGGGYGDAETLQDYAVGGNDVIKGGYGPSVMYGDGAQLLDHAQGGNDTLISGPGDDTMWGDAQTVGPQAQTGADLFVFSSPNGHDKIMDFEPGKDRIALQGFGLTSFADLATLFVDTPQGTLIRFDSADDILVSGVHQLSAGDFLIDTPPDGLTAIGPPELIGMYHHFTGPAAAAVIGPDQIAVVEQTVTPGHFTLTLDVFDPQGNLVDAGIANGALSDNTPADYRYVSEAIVGQFGVGAMIVVNSFDGGYVAANIGPTSNAYFQAVPLNGVATGLLPLGIPDETSGAVAFPGPTGFHLEWLTGDAASGFVRWQEDFTVAGAPLADTLTQTQGAALIPYAGITLAGAAFTIHDNIAQLDGEAPVGLPGEPAHAMTEAVAAALPEGTRAAVGWVDSGTDYVSLFDTATNSFGPTTVLDWGGASDLHLLALPQGGFVASWMNGGAYWGEVFSADGSWGGVIPLAGDVGGVASNGNFYTVGRFDVQQYQIDPGQVVSTSDANYTAPDGVRTVFMTGANQIVRANDQGDVIWSDNTENALYGGAGNDTLYLGRAGDWVLGNGGADVFKFREVPWAGDHILDFTPGDTVDLTIILSPVKAFPDPISAGYLKLSDDGAGNAEIWADYNQPGNDGWWLVATLDGVSSSSLHYANGMIT